MVLVASRTLDEPIVRKTPIAMANIKLSQQSRPQADLDSSDIKRFRVITLKSICILSNYLCHHNVTICPDLEIFMHIGITVYKFRAYTDLNQVINE